MDPVTLVTPTVDIVPFLNVFTGWLNENLGVLLTAAGGIALVGFAFRKAKSFLFG